MQITTKYRTDTAGRGKVTAKGGGKQRTVAYDQAKSANWNHAEAAGELALALGLTWHDGITHMGFNDGTHKFNL